MADQIIPPRRGEFLTPSGVATNRFNEYLERITTQTNTTTENTENLDSLDQSSMATSALSKRIDNLELLLSLQQNLSSFSKKLKVTSISADYLSVGNEVIVCTNTAPITITLNTMPNDGEEAIIKRQNTGTITVIGGVDGKTKRIIALRYDAPHLLYTNEAGEWSVI